MTAKLGARAFAFALAFLLTTISVTWAANQTITLELGAGSAVVLERPFKTVLIGDPNVVDVQTQSGRSVILKPLNLGATNLVFIDERGIAITNVRILVCSAKARFELRAKTNPIASERTHRLMGTDHVRFGSKAEKLQTSICLPLCRQQRTSPLRPANCITPRAASTISIRADVRRPSSETTASVIGETMRLA